MTDTICEHFVVAADDGCLDGHFPDAPIVPGVVLLNHVINAAERRFALAITGIVRCKFVAALYPEQRCEITLDAPSAGRLQFRCSGSDSVLVHGVLICDDPRAEHG